LSCRLATRSAPRSHPFYTPRRPVASHRSCAEVPPGPGRHLTSPSVYLCLARRGKRTDDRLEAFALGVLAVATTTNRLPKAFGRRRMMNPAWPFLLLLFTLVRPTTERER